MLTDSGCSSDAHPLDIDIATFLVTVRNQLKPIMFATANTAMRCAKGAKVRCGEWDCTIDCSLSSGAPSLMLIGQIVKDVCM